MFRRFLCFLLIAATGPAMAGEAVSVQLIWKHQFEFAAFYAAQEMGYYREAGLDVTIKEGGPSIDAVREILEGRADFGLGTSSLVLERYQGKPIVVLATLMQHSPIALLARRTSAVASVHDLAGKPIAVDPHSRDEVEAYLRSSGIPRDQLKFVDQSDWTLDSLDRGEIAAKAVYVSNEPFEIRGKEHQYLLLTPRSAGIDLFGNMLFTSEALVKRHPGTVEAFRQATLKGMVYALEHPDAVAELILARYNTQNKSRASLLYEASQIRELTRPDIVEPGYMGRGRWRHVVSVYASQGRLPADFDLDGFLYDPTPTSIPGWMKWVMSAALIAMFLAWAIVLRVRRFNRELRQEVAERKQTALALQASETKYRELVENANAVIVRIGPDGRLTYFNEVAEKVFGFSASEILGKHVVGSIVPEVESGSQRVLSRLIEAILAHPEQHPVNENENMTRDGRRIWMRWANQGIPDKQGQSAGILCIGHDITERHRLEQELEQYRQHLETMVKDRTAELSIAKEKAEAASQAKSTFLTNMSHELRTPFHGILGAIAVARKRMTDPKGMDFLDKATGATEHLLDVINDILDISKIEAEHLVLESIEFTLGPIFHNLLGLLAQRAEAKGLSLHTDLPRNLESRRLLGDPMRLSQVLINLIGNAVKFTEQGSVTIRVSEQSQSEDKKIKLRFEVIDTGIGIRASDPDRLFSAFEQADSSMTRQYGGTGIGLTICKRLVSLMGGEIGVESILSQGTRFWFEIALLEAEGDAADVQVQVASQHAHRINKEHSGKRVLLAEDEPVNQEVTRSMLEDVGLVVDVAADGEAAMRLASVHHYDLILMDMQMPIRNGIEATLAIRAETMNSTTPILAMTANAYGQDKERCFGAGMKDHIAKPVLPEQLYKVLAKWLEP